MKTALEDVIKPAVGSYSKAMAWARASGLAGLLERAARRSPGRAPRSRNARPARPHGHAGEPGQLRVALVSPYDLAVPGGVGQHIHHLDGELRSMGHKSWILGPCSDESASLPANVIRVSQTVMPIPAGGSIVRLDASPATYPRVKAILDRHRFDIIHVHEPLVPMLPWAVLRHSRSVNIGTFHATRDTDDTHAGYALGKPIIEPIFHRLHGLIAVSEPAREMVAQYYPGDYRIIPNGVDFRRFGARDVAPIERFADDRPTILFVGRLDKRKGFRHLLAAFGRVQAVLPDARLLVVGGYRSQSAEKYRDFVEEHGLRDVHFVGRVTDEDLPRYYHTADVFCAPSTGFESFGIVLLEAMAAGTPVVASDISGYRTIVTHGREGLLVPAGDHSALEHALVGLLRDEPMRQRMGDAGRATARLYDWPRVAVQVAAYYDEVLVKARA